MLENQVLQLRYGEQYPQKVTVTTPADPLPLPRQEQFAVLIAEGHTAAEAYRRAYDIDSEDMKPGTIRRNAFNLRHTQAVADRVRHLQAQSAIRSVMSTSELMADLEAMATADLSELIRVENFNCRFCWGRGHAHQWIDAAELARALDEYGRNKGATPLPSAAGGFGFVPTGTANPDCPRCTGSGVQRVTLGNTADASPGARRLFKGCELFPDGSVKRILLHDQLEIRRELHKLRGLHVERAVSLSLHGEIPTGPTGGELTPAEAYLKMINTRS
jgi:phage terminase small subunit